MVDGLLKTLPAMPFSEMGVLLGGNADFFGGIILWSGFFIRPISVLLVFAVLLAIFVACFSSKLFLRNHGYEFVLVLFATSTLLISSGVGKWSLDAVSSQRMELSV